MMVFVRTVHDAQRVSIVLRTLGFPAIPLHGQLSQSNRLGALNKFKSGGRQILIATDVASRGLDIPAVDYVVNYDIPSHSKDYIHRVGRTARAGRAGKSVTLVTQYDVELLQRIEGVVGKKMEEYACDATAVELFRPRVEEAQREAAREMREKGASGEGADKGRHGRKKRSREDGEGEEDAPSKPYKAKKGRRH